MDQLEDDGPVFELQAFLPDEQSLVEEILRGCDPLRGSRLIRGFGPFRRRQGKWQHEERAEHESSIPLQEPRHPRVRRVKHVLYSTKSCFQMPLEYCRCTYFFLADPIEKLKS